MSNEAAPAPQEKSAEEQPAQPRLVDVEISDENTALNVMVGFLNLAQRKGAFGFDESAKIWECINKFSCIDIMIFKNDISIFLVSNNMHY